MTVDLDDGGIDHGVFHVRLIRAGLEQLHEDIRLAPVAEAPERRAPVPEMRRQVAPWAARADNPEHRLDEAAVVAAAAPGVRWLTQTMRFHLRPLGVRQNIAIHPKLESDRCSLVNPHTP